MVMTSQKLLKNDRSSKNKNRKNLKFSFSFDSAHFHVNLKTFEINCGGGSAPHQKASRVWEFFLGLVDPSRNKLASTTYLAIVSSVFCMQGYAINAYIKIKITIFFFINSQIFMKDADRLNRKKNQISDFSDFHFSRYGHFCTKYHPNFRWIFTITWKIKIGILTFHSIQQYCASFMKTGSKLGGEEEGGRCLYILSWDRANIHITGSSYADLVSQ